MVKYLLLVTLFFCCGASAVDAPLPNDRRQIESEVQRLWAKGAFTELDSLEKQIHAGNLLSASGSSLLNMFYQAMEGEQLRTDLSEAEAKAEAENARERLSKYPQSQLAHFGRVNALMQVAWTIRGFGFANTVSLAQWVEFERLAHAASEHLKEHKALLSENPYWYSAMLRIGQQTSMSESTYRQLIEEGWSRHPGDPGLYISPIVHYTPKWGGSSAAMVDFIQRSIATLSNSEADEMYARQYSYAIENQLFPDLAQARYDCKRWLRGSASFTNRFPTPYNYNHAALVAVICNDKNRAKQYFTQLGESSPDPSIWRRALGRDEEYGRLRAWSRSVE